MIQQDANMGHKNRAVGYVRRSTDRQEQSIPDQKKALEQYAAEHGLRLAKFYVDDAISGTSTLGRKAFLQMIDDAQSPRSRFDIIVVYDVKRFGRIDNDEAGYYRYILRTHGVEVRYISENFNGDSTDDLLRPVKQWQARQESKDLSKVIIRGLISKSDTGCWVGGVPPYGYDLRYESYQGKFLLILRYMQDGSKEILDEAGKVIRTLLRGESLCISKRDYAKLTLSEPSRVKVIECIFRMYAEVGKGYRSIADTLNQQSIPTPRGPEWSRICSGKWTDGTIKSILVNPIYAGDMVWNRRADGRFHRISNGKAVDRDILHGTRLMPNKKEDWIIVRDAHPALVSRRLLIQTKQRLESNSKSIEQRQRFSKYNTHGKTWNGQRSRFILSGLMQCGLCGNRYQGKTTTKGKKRLDGTLVKISYYVCGGFITKGRSVCELNSIRQEVLEETVIDTVLNFYSPLLSKRGRTKLAEVVKTHISSEAKKFIASRKRAQRKLDKIHTTINNLLNSITSANCDFVDQQLGDLRYQKDKIEARLEELYQLSLSQAEINSIVSDSMKFIASLEFILRQGLPQEKLAALRQCVKKIDIDKAAGEIKLAIYLVPTGNVLAIQECKASILKYVRT